MPAMEAAVAFVVDQVSVVPSVVVMVAGETVSVAPGAGGAAGTGSEAVEVLPHPERSSASINATDKCFIQA